MSTQTSTVSPTLQANLMELPIFKHFDSNEIKTQVNSYRKGEFTISSFLKLLAFGGMAYLAYMLITVVIPQFFLGLGIAMYYVAIAGVALFTIISIPWLFGKARQFSKYLAKNLIASDPFGELEKQKQGFLNNQQTFRIAKSKIGNITNDMQVEAKKAEEDAHTYEAKVLNINTKAKALKDQLDNMVQTGGADARNSDEFVNGNAELMKLISEGSRISNKYEQSKSFISKYGTRAATMKKLGQKLTMVETSMEIKIADFDATVEMLKKDYEFAEKSKSATNAAKDSMLFDKSWQLEYAMDVVTSTIASDIAITSGNLRDIDSAAANYALDSDELYSNLDRLADKIKTGGSDIPTAKQYNNPTYQFTQNDKLGSNGLVDMF